jgi:hypothetical protein
MIGFTFALTLFLVFLGSIPVWRHSKEWGYAPSASLGLATLFLIIFISTIKI